ncbi:hypothetical protein HNQ51_001607 [Inhella inkyongensis]|uniref:Uncharacterized protein n=1 Tax=Inhella inkyongensis TaxID=392593 RepID=A0A840S3I6_9BURK|nr:hypothetical protein [Inhella inkyongensis]MBB5204293.1 hypothetical protein [Inhella inkyongensis]
MALWCGQNARPFVTCSALVYQPPRRPALPALAVLALHLGVGGVLIQQRSLPEPKPARVELRLIELTPPPRAVEPPSPRPLARSPTALPPRMATPEAATLPIPEFAIAAPGPNAITVLASPSAAASSVAAPSTAKAPLNLALPKDWKPDARNTPAQQAIHDPRANSPRLSAEQKLARRIGNEAEVIEMADGGTMTRRPDGSCTRVHTNRANALFAMDGPVGINTQGSCFNDKPGSAIQHARPR